MSRDEVEEQRYKAHHIAILEVEISKLKDKHTRQEAVFEAAQALDHRWHEEDRLTGKPWVELLMDLHEAFEALEEAHD